MNDQSSSSAPTPTQQLTLWIAGALLSLAVFGFLPRLTQNVESLAFRGLESGALLFGLFHTSVLHNVVHLLLGLAALLSAGSHRWCRTFLAITAAVLLTLVLYGQLDSTPVGAGLVPVGTANSWLYTLLALSMIVAAGFSTRRLRGRPDGRR